MLFDDPCQVIEDPFPEERRVLEAMPIPTSTAELLVRPKPAHLRQSVPAATKETP